MTISPELPSILRRRQATVLRVSVATLSASALLLAACTNPNSDTGVMEEGTSTTTAREETSDTTVMGALCNAFYSVAAAQADVGSGPLLAGTHGYLVTAQERLGAVEGEAEGDAAEQYDTAKKLIDKAVENTPDLTVKQYSANGDRDMQPVAFEGAAEGVQGFFTFVESLDGEQREQFDAAPVCAGFTEPRDVEESKVVTAFIDFMELSQGESVRDNEAFGNAVDRLPLENPPAPGSDLPDLDSDDYRVIAESIGEIAEGFEKWAIPADATDAERRALEPLLWHQPKLAKYYRAAADAAEKMAEDPNEDNLYELIDAALESGTASARVVRMVPPPNTATLDELVARQEQQATTQEQ
ncbi:hypothetical protein [Corynebacterium sp. CCM 9203]|uniref:hypothetical protein n=1 Tax=Corynebacterium sp. CCM 9203 TaxID=3057615 RepID=UPI0035258144